MIKFVSSDGLPAALWRDVACNVLPVHSFVSSRAGSRDQPHHIFPWLGIPKELSPTATVQPLDAHPAQAFWGMPRRLWLDFNEIRTGHCDCCGRVDRTLLTKLYSRPDGLGYEGPWRHPLSPYYEKTRDQWLCVHPQPGGIGYAYWLGAVLGGLLNENRIARARVVDAHLQGSTSRGKFVLWAFGYDMSKAKARCWYEATFPLFEISQANSEQQEALAQIVQWLLSGAEQANMYLRFAIHDVWAGDGDLRGDLGFVNTAFWSHTERAFFGHVEQAVRLAKTHAAKALDASAELRENWLGVLQAAVRGLFDRYAASGDVESCHPERLGEAHCGLMKQLHGGKLREALGLVKPGSPAGRKTGKSKAGSPRRKPGASNVRGGLTT